MKKITSLLLILIVFTVIGCRPSPETFYYRMAAPPGDETNLSFFRGPDSDVMLVNPSDAEVRNVIFCIGDGMGFNHIELAQRYAKPSNRLWMDTLPIEGQVTTHSADHDVTDSAASGTALACGIKTNNGMIGMNPDEVPYSSILELLDQKGWRTGLVVTSSISHATPAVFASHVDSRNKQDEIAQQLFENRVDVLLGGGKKFWDEDMLTNATAEGYQVIETRDQIPMLKFGPVLGLFADDGLTTFDPEPMLPEMVHTAITLLSSKSREWFVPQPKFFLMIEGSQIDWAGHANDADRMVRQTLLFDMAVKEALDFAQRDEHTLVIVTSDHETGGLQIVTDDEDVKIRWTTSHHTDANVPIFAYGPGAEKFAGKMDNTDIPKCIAELTGIDNFPVVRQEAEQGRGTIATR